MEEEILVVAQSINCLPFSDWKFTVPCPALDETSTCHQNTLPWDLFFDAFETQRQKANIIFAISLSAYPQQISRLQMDKFSANFMLEIFTKICRSNSSVVQIAENSKFFSWRWYARGYLTICERHKKYSGESKYNVTTRGSICMPGITANIQPHHNVWLFLFIIIT
jgi:hypothetical protein